MDDAQLERFAISSAARAQVDGEGSASGQDGETFLTPEGFSLTTSEPLVVAAMRALAQAWPAAVEFSTLAAVAREAAGRESPAQLVVERLRTVLLQAYLARIVQLQACAPPLVAQAGERPLASGLARAQQAAGRTVVSSLLHVNVQLQGDVEPRLLGLLGGELDREALRCELAGTTHEQVEDALASLAASGLLSA